MSVHGRGSYADLGCFWCVADDNASVNDVGLTVAKALTKTCVPKKLTYALRSVMLAAQSESCVSLDFVQNSDWGNYMSRRDARRDVLRQKSSKARLDDSRCEASGSQLKIHCRTALM